MKHVALLSTLFFIALSGHAQTAADTFTPNPKCGIELNHYLRNLSQKEKDTSSNAYNRTATDGKISLVVYCNNRDAV